MEEEFQICKLSVSSHSATICYLHNFYPRGYNIFSSFCPLHYKVFLFKWWHCLFSYEFTNYRIVVEAIDGETSGLFVSPNTTIAELKKKIGVELDLATPRVLLGDRLLYDDHTVQASRIVEHSCIKIAKHKRKRAAKTQRPGASQRRMMRV